MIRRIAILLTMFLMLGCSASAEDKRVLAATTYPLYDIARTVGGEFVEAVYAPEGGEQAAKAHIVLCVGGPGDAWTADSDAMVLRAIDGLELMDTEGNPAMEDTQADLIDTDVMTIPVHNMLCASALADALIAADAEHAEEYRENLAAYIDQMIDLDARFREAAAGGLQIACADGSMRYFLREYELTYAEDSAAEAVVLSTYDHPAEEDIQTPYVQLMERNLSALLAASSNQ